MGAHRTPGALTWREISNSIIVDSDLVIFFCTPSTLTSYGQALETEYALNNRVKNLAISLDNSEVPRALTARNYETWDSTRFAEKCNNLANRLPQILDSIHELEQLPVTKQESSPIANRLRSLSELNERTAGVDPQRVEEAQTEILASYLQATIPMYIARSAEEDNPNFQEFLLLGFLERAKLEDFNSSSHWWGPYVSDIGRALAAREQHYLQEAIGQQIRAVNTTISRSDPKFRVLTEHVTDLVKRGLTPDVLLAPIELFVPFVKYYEAELNWSHRPERLKIGNVELRVHWSHRYAPSTCFTLFDHNAGTWRIYPDQATGTAITIALGQSNLYPNMFEIGVVTTVKYDVTEPDAFCRICVSD